MLSSSFSPLPLPSPSTWDKIFISFCDMVMRTIKNQLEKHFAPIKSTRNQHKDQRLFHTFLAVLFIHETFIYFWRCIWWENSSKSWGWNSKYLSPLAMDPCARRKGSLNVGWNPNYQENLLWLFELKSSLDSSFTIYLGRALNPIINLSR